MTQGPAQRMLSVWDRGRAAREPVRRTLELLQLSDAAEAGEPAAFPVGHRDARLLDIYEDLFGRELSALVMCETCGEELEVSIPVESVRTEHSIACAGEWHTIEREGGVVEFRLPNSEDLLAVAGISGIEPRRSRLLERLVRRREASTGLPVALAEQLQGEFAVEVERRMAELDPQAEIRLEFQCDSCQTAFGSWFDIGSFLWAELDAWALRTLRDVHLLARGYGWSEASILGLDPRRRRVYVEMLSQ